jgi:hypothetical protein
MNTLRTISLTIAMLAASSAYARQGIVMVMNETNGGQTSQNRMQLDRTRVRTDIRDQGRVMTVTFDGNTKVMRMIDTPNKSYTEITQQDVQQIGGMMAQMMEQMKNMPAEQRQMMEQMMRGRGGAGMPGMTPAPAPITYKKTGSARVGQWDCTTYEGFRGAEKVAEVCAAEGSLGLSAADFQVMQQLADFVKSMAPQNLEQLAMYGTAESQGFAGFPVRRVTFQNGRAQSTSELSELRREAIPDSAFAVPSGFRKQSVTLGR